MGSEAVIEYRKRRKENLMKVCGSKCAICGYNKLAAALEFHHIDPSQKEYGIATGGNCHDLDKDLAEIKKCLLVCANCHREIHANMFTEEELWQRQIYLEEVALSLQEDKYIRTATKLYFCGVCGVSITKYSDSGLCHKCLSETQRVVNRPTRSQLKEDIRTLPMVQVGKKYLVSDNAVRKWCKAYDLPSKVSEIKKYTDEEWKIL